MRPWLVLLLWVWRDLGITAIKGYSTAPEVQNRSHTSGYSLTGKRSYPFLQRMQVSYLGPADSTGVQNLYDWIICSVYLFRWNINVWISTKISKYCFKLVQGSISFKENISNAFSYHFLGRRCEFYCLPYNNSLKMQMNLFITAT